MRKMMLLILFIILNFVTIFTSYADTEKVIINNKEYEIDIPNNYIDLKEAFIETTQLYIETRDDLNTTLKNNDILIQSIDSLTFKINDLVVLNDEAIQLLKKKKEIKFWESIMFLSASYYLPDRVGVNIGYGGLLFENIFLGMSLGFPFNARLDIGFKF